MADRLIDACHMTSDFVTVVQGSKRHRFPYRKARAFLQGMLQGRSWSEGVPYASGGGTEAAVSMLPTIREGRSPKTYPLEPALGEMLRIASEMEIIQESKHDAESGMVTIFLSSCETEMSEGEALAFLAECILHKLNELCHLPAPRPAEGAWNGGDGEWASAAGQPLD